MFGILIKKFKVTIIKFIVAITVFCLALMLFEIFPVKIEFWFMNIVKFVWMMLGFIGIYACLCVFEQNN
jgi:hypothetical protein